MKKRIMIVDDESLITSTLSNLLELMLECDVVVYNNPKEALNDAKLIEQNIDMVISDFMMPELDGFEFLRSVQELNPTSINILLTGYSDKNNAIKCINELNLYYYLEKPWNNEDLLKVIDNGFEKRALENALENKMLELEKSNHEVSRLYNIVKEAYDDEKDKNINLLDSNSQLETKVVQRTFALQSILDHVEQGFLIIEDDMSIQQGYSVKCVDIFMKRIEDENLAELLFPNDLEQQNFLSDVIKDLLNTVSIKEYNLLYPLLPTEVKINQKPIQLTFKRVSKEKQQHLNNPKTKFIVVLTDISDKRVLENLVEEERNRLKMVVEVITSYRDYRDLVRDYQFFVESYLDELLGLDNVVEIISTIFRQIHTFKGTCAQLNLVHSTKRFHELENQLNVFITNDQLKVEDLKLFLNKLKLIHWLDEDLNVIEFYLGKTLLNVEDGIIVEKHALLELEQKIRQTFSKADSKPILEQLYQICSQPVFDLLKQYIPYVERLSEELNKPMKPLIIQDGGIAVDPDLYRDFFRSLIHIIRNMMDHGIENVEERLLKSKSEFGEIKIQLKPNDNRFIIRMTNDGQALDYENIYKNALNKGYQKSDLDQMSHQEVLMLIFEDFISTKEKVTMLSGRGVGLSAVKAEIARLGGEVSLESDDHTTSFIFDMPYFKQEISQDIVLKILHQAIEKYLSNNNQFKKIMKVETFKNIVEIGSSVKVQGKVNFRTTMMTSIKDLETLLADQTSEKFEFEMLQAALGEILNTLIGNVLQLLPSGHDLLELSYPIDINSTACYQAQQNLYLIEGEDVKFYLNIEFLEKRI